jgi:hypothetical protein
MCLNEKRPNLPRILVSEIVDGAEGEIRTRELLQDSPALTRMNASGT